MANKIVIKSPQDHHFFGTTPFNWATGSTRAEVLRKLAVACGSSILKNSVKSGGLYAYTIKVMAPEATEYAIDSFQPVGVKTTDAQEFMIQNTKGHSLPVDRD